MSVLEGVAFDGSNDDRQLKELGKCGRRLTTWYSLTEDLLSLTYTGMQSASKQRRNIFRRLVVQEMIFSASDILTWGLAVLYTCSFLGHI